MSVMTPIRPAAAGSSGPPVVGIRSPNPSAGLWLGLIGPPGAGKTTIADALAASCDAVVWRMQDASRPAPARLGAKAARGATPYAPIASHPQRTSRPSRGMPPWVPPPVVADLLHADLVSGRLPSSGLVVLDNAPSTVGQLALFAAAAARAATRLVVVELALDDTAATNRLASGEPSAPMRARLRHYRRTSPRLSAAARQRGVPLIVIDATPDLPAVAAAVVAAFAATDGTPSPYSRGRREQA